MALLTVPELQAAFETDLPPAALQLYLDAAEADIVERCGDPTVQVDRVTGRTRQVFLTRRAASITSVKEIVGADVTVLTEGTDFAQRLSGRALERIGSGAAWATYEQDYPVFSPVVEVTYVPVDAAAKHKRVQLDLVKLAITYEGGIKSESSGDYQFGSARLETYEEERLALLSSLVPTIGVTC